MSTCANRITCPASDSPFANVSSEDPDPFLFLGVKFCGWYSPLRYGPYPKVVFGTDGVDAARLEAAALCPVEPVGFQSPVPVGPPPAYPNSGAVCLEGCDKPPATIRFTNTAQSCTACCPMGPCETFTMPADRIQGRTQAEADLWAHKFACRTAAQMALAHCPDTNCLIIDGVTVCKPGDFIPPYNPPAAIAIYWNAPTSCSATCPDGSISTFFVRGVIFSGRTQAQADVAANSYACRQAFLRRFCLTDLAGKLCLGSSQTYSIIAFGGTGNVTWSLASGALPSGMSGAVSGRNFIISGTPTSPGLFTFSLHAEDGAGNARDKTFTIDVLGIIEDFSLPSASNGVFYTTSLTADGGSSAYTFSLLSGALPFGLTVGGSGTISGTVSEPTTANFPFVVRLTDGTGRICDKAFNIFVQSGCTIVDASPLPAFTQGVAYSHQLTVSGGVGPFTWVKTAGSFPTGISLASSGLISGTASSNSDTTFTVRATGSDLVQCEAILTLPHAPCSGTPTGLHWHIGTFVGLPQYDTASGSVDEIAQTGSASVVCNEPPGAASTAFTRFGTYAWDVPTFSCTLRVRVGWTFTGTGIDPRMEIFVRNSDLSVTFLHITRFSNNAGSSSVDIPASLLNGSQLVIDFHAESNDGLSGGLADVQGTFSITMV